MRWSATCRKEKETDKSLQITERSQDKKCTQKNIGHFFDIWVMPKMAVMSHMLRGKCVRTKALSNLLIPVENTVHYMTLAALSAASCASLLCTNKVKKMHEHFSHVFFLSSHFCYFFFFFFEERFSSTLPCLCYICYVCILSTMEFTVHFFFTLLFRQMHRFSCEHRMVGWTWW